MVTLSASIWVCKQIVSWFCIVITPLMLLHFASLMAVKKMANLTEDGNKRTRLGSRKTWELAHKGKHTKTIKLYCNQNECFYDKKMILHELIKCQSLKRVRKSKHCQVARELDCCVFCCQGYIHILPCVCVYKYPCFDFNHGGTNIEQLWVQISYHSVYTTISRETHTHTQRDRLQRPLDTFYKYVLISLKFV